MKSLYKFFALIVTLSLLASCSSADSSEKAVEAVKNFREALTKTMNERDLNIIFPTIGKGTIVENVYFDYEHFRGPANVEVFEILSTEKDGRNYLVETHELIAYGEGEHIIRYEWIYLYTVKKIDGEWLPTHRKKVRQITD